MVGCQIPAFGYTTIWLWRDGAESPADSPFTCTDCSVSNGIAEIKFSKETGELVSYKVRGKELINGSATRLYDETHCDTWAHDIAKFDKVSEVCRSGNVKVYEVGSVRAKVRTEQTLGDSKIIRDYIMYAGSERVEVETKIDFYSRHRMLKFGLTLAAENPEAFGEIPFGFIKRSTDGSEHSCGEWIALKSGEIGLGIATDSKYSFSANGNELEFVVLRGAIFADHGGERTEFSEYMDMGRHEFRYTLFPFSTPGGAKRVAAELNNPPELICETFHKGELQQNYSGAAISAQNVAITAIKRHEDSDSTVVRLYETDNLDTECTLTLFGKEIPLKLSHSEVKTLIISPSGEVKTTDFIE